MRATTPWTRNFTGMARACLELFSFLIEMWFSVANPLMRATTLWTRNKGLVRACLDFFLLQKGGLEWRVVSYGDGRLLKMQ